MYGVYTLVGGWATPLKNISQLGWLATQYEWENKKCSKPPTRYRTSIWGILMVNVTIYIAYIRILWTKDAQISSEAEHICIYLPTYVSTYLSTYLSIYLSFYLSIYLSIYLSFYLSIYLSVFFSLDLSMRIPSNRQLSEFNSTLLIWWWSSHHQKDLLGNMCKEQHTKRLISNVCYSIYIYKISEHNNIINCCSVGSLNPSKYRCVPGREGTFHVCLRMWSVDWGVW